MVTFLLSQTLTQSAARFPDHLALVDKQRQYTYTELDEASNRFANHLIACGVKRGDRVGLYLEKSLEAVASLFGILKAGAAYVPLDPGAPLARVAYMITDCKIAAMVCSRAHYEALNAFPAVPTSAAIGVAVDGDASWRKASPLPPPDPHAIERDLAYILYTSGSTGNPKGVMISHRAALTFVEWAAEEFDVQPGDRVSSHAPFHFDLSTFDLFSTIKAGATVVLVPPTLSLFPASLAKFISEQRINIWYSVPSALTRLLLYGNLTSFDLAALRTVLFAGEVFPVKYLRCLMRILPHASFHNLYGPTETNVCTWYTVPPLDPERSEPISIGKACPNHEVLVLGDDGSPVARGETGELCVRGPGLMTGYWGLPERTAASLAPCVLYELIGPEPVYRTGDLVREEADGNYTYLGRRDNQIKSRGYRIELGEVETALYSHPHIEEAAVIAVPDEEIGNQIKAFVVYRNGVSLPQSDLEAYCSTRLPKYMLPHLFEVRSALPKTATGKVDKTKLQFSAQALGANS
jgi:amino acid adenylation domain-containing protein